MPHAFTCPNTLVGDALTWRMSKFGVRPFLTLSRKKSPTSKRGGAVAPVKVGDEFWLGVAESCFSHRTYVTIAL